MKPVSIQQGGDIRRLEDRQAGVYRLGLVQTSHPTDLGENLLADVVAFTA